MKAKYLQGKVECYGFTDDKINPKVSIDKKLPIKDNFENNRLIACMRDNNGVYYRDYYTSK